MSTAPYLPLTYPDVPPGWRFCMVCGSAMEWAEEGTNLFSRQTGSPLMRRAYACPNGDDVDGRVHDRVDDGTAIASMFFAVPLDT